MDLYPFYKFYVENVEDNPQRQDGGKTYLIGNVGNVLNQTTGYDGSERNVEPLTHVVQAAGKPNVDSMDAIGAR